MSLFIGIGPPWATESTNDHYKARRHPIGFVVTINVHRRHLEKSQLAVIALYIEKIEAVLANERMLVGKPSDPSAKVRQGEKGKSSEKAAKAVGVGARYVSDAKRIEKEAPELLPEIRAGNLTISKAKKQLNQRERQDKFADADNISTMAETAQMLELLGNFLLEIRKRMGNYATKLDKLAMLEWFINDVRKIAQH